MELLIYESSLNQYLCNIFKQFCSAKKMEEKNCVTSGECVHPGADLNHFDLNCDLNHLHRIVCCKKMLGSFVYYVKKQLQQIKMIAN